MNTFQVLRLVCGMQMSVLDCSLFALSLNLDLDDALLFSLTKMQHGCFMTVHGHYTSGSCFRLLLIPTQ